MGLSVPRRGINYSLNYNSMKNWQRYIVSSIVTFLGAFCVVLVSDIDSITIASFKDGAVLGLIFVAVRAGIKAVLEWVIATFKI